MILIGLPAYNCQLHLDVLNSLLAMTSKIPFDVMGVGNESLILRGRNTIISHFVYDKKYSHLLFLDADIKINPNDILKLLAHNLDIIGAPVPLKGHDANGNKIYNVVNPIRIKDNLHVCDKVGTAVMLISREAATALCMASEEYDAADKPNVQYDVFRTCVEKRVLLSEDFYMCKKARELGYEVYVDDSIMVDHNGMIKV